MSTSRKKTKNFSSLMDKGFHTLDTVITGVDSLAETVNKVAPGIVDETTKVIDYHLDKHKDDFKMPSLIDVPLEEAERVLKLYNLHYSLVLTKPDPKYADARPNVVLAITPKENTNVSTRTFVRAYYADNSVIEASQQLAHQQETAKRQAAEDNAHVRQAQVAKLTKGIQSFSLNAKKLATTLTPRKKTRKVQDVQKPIEATTSDTADTGD